MPSIFCHNCERQFAVPSVPSECPACGEGFIEEVQGRTPPLQAEAPAAGGPGGRGYSRTFTLPGGGGSISFYTSTGGGGGPPPLGGFDPFGGAMPGMPGGDPFVSGVLEALMGGGFLQPGARGGGFGGLGVPAPGGGGGAAAEQEWLDRVMSQIMAEYQPASQATSQRAVASLPRLRVRAAGVQGEPGEGEAVARAGEQCSVCHDEYKAGDEVMELPCQHCYHADCLMPWLETHNTCPVCRHELPAEDPGVEARRRQRTEEAGAPRRSVRPRPTPAPSGNRLSDLLGSISARWESLHRDGSADASAGAAAGQAAAGGAAAAAAAAGGSRRQADTASATTSSRPASAASGSGLGSTSGGMRQRREAAAEAAERRLRGEAAVPSAPPAAAYPPTAPPARRPTQPQQAQRPPPLEEDSGSDSMAAGAVLGGVLGAVAGAAWMLLGRRGNRS